MPYSLGSGGVAGAVAGRNQQGGKVLERVKTLSYSATVNKLLLDVESDTTEGSVKTDAVGEIEIVNTGKHPAFAIFAYGLWTAEGTMDSNVYYVNYLLKSGQGMVLPDAPAIIQDEDNNQYDGTAITNAVPSVTANYAYADSGTTIDDATFEDADTSITVDDGISSG